MKFPTTFSSERLFIRRIDSSDWESLLNGFCSNGFPSRLPLARLNTESKVKSWILDRLQDWELGTGFVWTLELKTTGLIIGQISLFPRNSAYALAYWVKAENYQNGYATESCFRLIEVIKLSGYQNQLWAGTAEWNKASASVLRKLNFRSTGSNTYLLSNGIEEHIHEYVLDL